MPRRAQSGTPRGIAPAQPREDRRDTPGGRPGTRLLPVAGRLSRDRCPRSLAFPMQSTYSQLVSGSSLAETTREDPMLYESRLKERLDGSAEGIRHAVVIGGSIGGMLAARVLADHFD